MINSETDFSIINYNEGLLIKFGINSFQNSVKNELYRKTSLCFNNCYNKVDGFMEKVDKFMYKKFLNMDIEK